MTPDVLVRRANACKVKLSDKRPEFPREFPYYLDSNRFLSNVPGSTILFPVVDMTRQYINALMYLLTEPDGHRPAFLDDRNFYLPAGVKEWIKSGFLNKDIKLPLGVLGTMRTQIEAELLLQNLILMLQAMGLGRLDSRLGRAHQAAAGPGIRAGHAPLPRARFLPLGDLSYRGAVASSGAAAAHQGNVPSLLQDHGGGGAGGGRFEIRPRRHLQQ